MALNQHLLRYLNLFWTADCIIYITGEEREKRRNRKKQKAKRIFKTHKYAIRIQAGEKTYTSNLE